MVQINDDNRTIAIEFAKYICQTKISKESDILDIDGNKQLTSYWPHEFELILGQLVIKGDEIFDNFLINYDTERTTTISTGSIPSII
jgi:hypothetical protein